MKRIHSEESGIILVIVIFALALMGFGYVAITNISKSREAERVKDSASDVIETTDQLFN